MGEVQSKASEVKGEKEKKGSEEPELSTKDLLKVISTQNEQLLKQGEEISTIKEHFNKLVDQFSELGEALEKGAGKGKGSLAEIAMLLKAVAPLMRGSESDPFRDIGVYTFKQFLRTSMGKKGSKKIMKDIFAEKKEEEEEKEEE